MLSRPGSKPGPVWMRRISDSFSDPERSLKMMMPFWAFFIIYMIVCIGLTHFVTAVVLSKDYVYESSTRIAGLPLISYSPAAHGIIAIGGRATGVIALGGLAFGFIAIGGVTAGVISFGGISIGLFALAGVSPWLACVRRLGRWPLRSWWLRHRQICVCGKWCSLRHRRSQRPPERAPDRLSLIHDQRRHRSFRALSA